MKLVSYLAVTALCLTTNATNAATSRVGKDGTRYEIDEWSLPQQVDLSSTDVPIQVLKRSTIIQRMAFQQAACFSIDLLSAMNSPTVWIGAPYDHYFAIGEEIYGAATEGTVLLIKGSIRGDTQDEDAILERALGEFFDDPRFSRSVQGATHAFNLNRIFGHETNRPEGDSRAWMKPVTITGVSPQATTVIFALHTVAGNDLILTFGHEFDLISASKNGEAVIVLQDGRFPLVLDWPGARAISLPSESGPVSGLTSSKVYYRDHKRYYNEEGQGRLAFPMRVVAIPSTGNLWIGPSDSRLLVQNGSVVGFLPSKGNELLVFTGRPRTIHAEDARITYQQELSNFENDLLAGRFAEKSRVNISTFLPDASLTINDIFFADSDIVLRLIASGPKGNSKVELKIGRDLRVTSAEALR